MKITHVCVNNIFVDDFGYQENIITDYHSENHEVSVMASTNNAMYPTATERQLTEGEYMYHNNIRVMRLSPKLNILDKLVVYRDFYNKLDQTNPDMIMIHNINFLNMKDIARYKKNHPECIIVADSHGDYGNSASNFLSMVILNKIIWRYIVQKYFWCIDKMYATTPWVKLFANGIYKIPNEKIDLLPLGADDRNVDFDSKEQTRLRKREELGISEDDLVIIHGGQFDSKKRTVELINAFKKVAKENMHLLIFGTCRGNYEQELRAAMGDDARIHYLGWTSAHEVYDLYFASDMACFPGTNSVLWQQAIFCGLPLLIKYWYGSEYLDLGGNIMFVSSNEMYELEINLNLMATCKELRENMSKVANEKGMEKFSYKAISQKIIDDVMEIKGKKDA